MEYKNYYQTELAFHYINAEVVIDLLLQLNPYSSE